MILHTQQYGEVELGIALVGTTLILTINNPTLRMLGKDKITVHRIDAYLFAEWILNELGDKK